MSLNKISRHSVTLQKRQAVLRVIRRAKIIKKTLHFLSSTSPSLLHVSIQNFTNIF